MSAQTYVHTVLTIKCCIGSSTLKKDTTNIKFKHLKRLLSKIPKKFKFLNDMDDNDWQISINGTVIDKSNAKQFDELLSTIPPIPVVEIVKTEISNDCYIITVHYGDKQFDYTLEGDKDDWDQDVFEDLESAIRKEFDLESEFGLYEDVGGAQVEVDDIDDIVGGFGDDSDDSDDSTSAGSSENKTLLHIFVKVPVQATNQFKIVYGTQSFCWVPPNPNEGDEKQWEQNYDALLNEINKRYHMNKEDIQLQQMEDGVECDIDCGDDMLDSWQELLQDDDHYEIAIIIANDPEDAPPPEVDGTIEDVGEDEPIPKPVPVTKKEKIQQYKSWFDDVLQLPQYYEVFIAAGYENLDYLDADIDEEDLTNDIGIKLRPHRKRILNEIKKLVSEANSGESHDKSPDKAIRIPVAITDEVKNGEEKDVAQMKASGNGELNTWQCEMQEELIQEQENKQSHKDLDESDDEKEGVKEQSVEELLSNLGSCIGNLSANKKKLCFSTITSIKDQAQSDDSTQHFASILAAISKQESAQFVNIVLGFLRILGYVVTKLDKANEYNIKGAPTEIILNEVSSKFHHLVNAMQDPSTDIYQSLNIKIPTTAKVLKHKTGIYDNKFIIFELPQILMENQQTSLVNKVVLYPNHLERFINFLSPDCSKHLCKDIYFDKLSSLKLASIGLFGSHGEVLDMMQKYNAISKALYNALTNDDDNEYLKAGIHAIIPIHLQQHKHNMKQWNRIIYFFYWSLPNSFDMSKMKTVSRMRKDPSCLLTRVLYEISSTVCIEVSSDELNDFGVIERDYDDDDGDNHGDDDIEDIVFKMEETKENHIMCENTETKYMKLSRNSHSHSKPCNDMFILNGAHLNGYCRLFTQKARPIQDLHLYNTPSEEKLTEFFQTLDKKWVIAWDSSFNNDSVAKFMVVKAVMFDRYNEHEKEISRLEVDKAIELDKNALNKQANITLKQRNEQILQEFFNFYIRSMKNSHKSLEQILHDLADDLAEHLFGAIDLIKMKYKETVLDSHDYNQRYWRDLKIRNMVKETKTILQRHKKPMNAIQGKYEDYIDDIDRRNKPKSNKDKWWIQRVVGNDDDDKLAEMNKAEWNQYKKELKNDAVLEMQREITEQRNKTIRDWFRDFNRILDEYKKRVYGDRYGSIIHFRTIKEQIKTNIERKYGDKKSNLTQILFQQFKSEQHRKKRLETVTLKRLTINRSYHSSTHYDVQYTIPKTIPPSYDVQFCKIDLPSLEDEMKVNSIKNMHYEIPITDELLYHQMVNNEVIMFVRHDFEESKSSETKIVISHNSTLAPNQKASVLKRGRVQKASYFAPQKLFAVLFEDRLAFAKLQEGVRVAFTDKGCDLHDMAWWQSDMKFEAVLMQEDDSKNLFVWFVDDKQMVRAFDYDTNDWDASKEFELDQRYESCILSPEGAFLVGFKPQYEEDEVYTPGNQADIEDDDEKYEETTKEEEEQDTLPHEPGEAQKTEDEAKEADTTSQKNSEEKPPTPVLPEPSPEPSPAPLPPQQPLKTHTPTGRIQLHVFLLSEKRKLVYRIHKDSLTGYEVGDEPELSDDNRDILDIADNVLLPKSFSIDRFALNKLSIQSTTKKDAILLCGIDMKNEFCFHPLHVQVSDERLKIHEHKKHSAERKITKLDYMEYMIEKFGSRAAIYYPQNGTLALHTTYIMTDFDIDAKHVHNMCAQIQQKICRSLYDKEKKDFKWLDWKYNVFFDENDTLLPSQVMNPIKNKYPFTPGDVFIKNLIVQIPIQIARGVNNKFQLMYNGEDNQKEYMNAVDSYSLCKTIRLGAYDGLIKSWSGKIKIVTSMGKQSTGKSYMLNHLFGTKFDISGGRCTDGAWLSVKIINDVLYILCDFEGLGSFERSPQEDMLLATFNAALSNCTVFKCDNRFDRTVEEMFNKFQSGVKIMSGSENCFAGKLLLIIKDVVETGAQAAKADFKRHIVRLAQESPLIRNEQTKKKESTFFVDRMYKSGLGIVPYPPLATEKFFTKLNSSLQPQINKIGIVHDKGGNVFLDHLKLIMSKLNIGDWAAMSDEHAKMRTQEIRNNLQNAIIAGTIKQPPKNNEYITFNVEDEQNLLLLEGNMIISVSGKEAAACIKRYESFDEKEAEEICIMVEALDDAGLILGKIDEKKGVIVGNAESLKFLYDQFCVKMKRNHDNVTHWTDLYQLFLDLIYWRRNLRVNKYIGKNTEKFKEFAQDDIDSLIQSAETQLNVIRDKMKCCKTKCEECFYPCLLCKNHEDDEQWDDEHTCYQSDHKCKEYCVYCIKNDGETVICGDSCGHSGKHNCRKKDHTCGEQCSLAQYKGCQEKCNLESGHVKDKEPCKCNAETHYCKEICDVPKCNNSCKMPYNAKHGHHICIQKTCPYKCQVKCWNDSLKAIVECGRDCSCDNHAHHLETDEKTNMDELHICNERHLCPEQCNEDGNCKVSIERHIKEETLITGAGSEIKYNAYAEANAEKKRCHKKIPAGTFRHEGNDHRCYEESKAKDHIHKCDVRCDSCGYFCEEKFGHYKENGSLHYCQHGNMRDTIFYATEEIVDTGDNRKYKVGDTGAAEMCDMFCTRMGRGHIHLELCTNIDENGNCVEDKEGGRRHQQKKYQPNPEIPKDEVQHSKFWKRKKWRDPCNLKKVRDSFDLCNFACQHPSHAEKEKDKKEEDITKYCTKKLWHKPCSTSTKHHFKCTHPFGNAHVIFTCDISGSMSLNDGKKSKAEYAFIKNSGSLDNRLGALYSAIHKFLDVRIQKGCIDTVSAVMTPGYPAAIAAQKVKADKDFVQKYLLRFKPYGCENYGQAFRDTERLIEKTEETVVIFLCDGYSGDSGAKSVTRNLRNQMGKKFSLFCITLGPAAYNNNKTVKDICDEGGGQMVSTLSGNELGKTFTSIAKQMNTGTFGKL